MNSDAVRNSLNSSTYVAGRCTGFPAAFSSAATCSGLQPLRPLGMSISRRDGGVVPDSAATAVLRGAVYATGQVCYSVERVYVHESVHDAFV